ncbi:MAG: uracil-DNA glycosylase [Desulfosalsimonadaceae bacterium]
MGMKTNANEFDALVGEIQKHLVFLQAVGCAGAHLNQESIRIVRAWENPFPASLADVFDEYLQCRRCGLASAGKASVFGAGSENADLMFVGFAPRREDEGRRHPYTGKEGALLTRIIGAMALDRDSVYICHAVKCLPPGGAPPGKWEAKACRYYLLRQIQAIRPSVICVFGEGAAGALLGAGMPFARMRGRFFDYEGIPVMPTYDPSHVLADPSARRPVWEDMQKIMKKLDGSE